MIIGRWYDPVSEKWVQPLPPLRLVPDQRPEDDHARAQRLVHATRVWDAVTATALASQQGDGGGVDATAATPDMG